MLIKQQSAKIITTPLALPSLPIGHLIIDNDMLLWTLALMLLFPAFV